MVARGASAAGPVLLACRQWDPLGLARRLPSLGAGAWRNAPLLPWRVQCPVRVSALPSHTLCPPASASTVRSNSRGSAPSLPPSLPRPPGPVLPPVCSPSLTLPCPSSLVAGSPASCLSVPLVPLSPRRAQCRAMRKATLPLPLSLAAPWCHELLVCGTHFVPHTIPPGAGSLAAAARPGFPLAASGQLGRGAPPSFLPLVRSH